MIKGKGLNELKKYRLELISLGIAAGEIPDETFFGHCLSCIKDPDGNGRNLVIRKLCRGSLFFSYGARQTTRGRDRQG
jgi:hypothetical protein